MKSRLVVYGGHDTWLKAMKGYVNGDIRFIDKDQGILDRSVIRNADAVWIQHINATKEPEAPWRETPKNRVWSLIWSLAGTV